MAKLILDYYSGKDLYSDGQIEDTILNIVKKHDPLEVENAIKNSNDWALLYHLKGERGNIIVPCDIIKDDQCLEIGSGCGAITEAILKYSEHVDCIELSKRRSEINKERNYLHEELNIYVGNFQEIAPKITKKYDKIFLIGVLEYAPSYIADAENPFIKMLTMVKALLKDDGNLFIAIENKYGMKYFSGAKEDHTGNIFESIEGYKTNHVKTFSSIQLRQMLNEVGFSNLYFYYPLPDYKFPNIIYSEDYLPKTDGISNIGHSLDRDRTIIFDENKALVEAAKSGTFEIFANSFLIKAGQ